MLSSHFPPAMLQRTATSWEACTCLWYPGFMSGALVFVAATQGMPLDHLVPVVSRTVFTSSMGW